MSGVKKKISALAVVEIILIVVLALIMAAMLAFNFLFKDKDAPITILGYSFYNTKAVTMLPRIPANTLIIAKASEKENIVEGSVILCKIGDNTVLIRVEQIQQEEGNTSYIVKFDSKGDKIRVNSDAIIAKAVWQNKILGSLISFASTTPGMIVAVVIPLIFIIAIQVVRILSIHRLEDEAASLDDIDEFMNSRDEETPAAVTFTEPKFIEDVTGKIPSPVTALKVERQSQTQPVEKVLSVDGRGRAEYSERKTDKPAEDNSPLFTYDRIAKEKEQARKEPAAVGASKAISRDELYLNKPTRIEREKSAADEFFEKYVPKASQPLSGGPDLTKGEPVVFTPHLSNIIPDSIAAVQEQTDSPKRSDPADEAKPYFEKTYAPEGTYAEARAAENPRTIPEKAVRPKETIAPPKKQRSNKAVAELMSIIDAEETKLKK